MSVDDSIRVPAPGPMVILRGFLMSEVPLYLYVGVDDSIRVPAPHRGPLLHYLLDPDPDPVCRLGDPPPSGFKVSGLGLRVEDSAFRV